MNILDKIMKKLDEKLRGMNDRELKWVQYIALIIAIIGEIAIFVLSATWFDNFIGHILAALSFIFTFYLILDMIFDISIDMDKRQKEKDDSNKKIIKINDYKKYKKGE